MTEANKTEVSATGFAPHIEELHEFFRSRGVVFGKPEDLNPFVERLSKDESFRDEMASMVRAIIYRERDGLTPAELMELLVTAVTGTPAEDEPEEARDAVRQMMGFAAGVFRSRWNPGASAARAEDGPAAGAEVEAAGDAAVILPTNILPTNNVETTSAVQEPAARPTTPMFYQAQVVANGGTEPDEVVPLREKNESEAAQTAAKEPTAAEEVIVPPVAAFLRGDSAAKPMPGVERSRGWAWVAVVLAMVVSFGAGMFARQWMLLRGVAWPLHTPAALTLSHNAAPTAARPGPVPPASGAATAVPTANVAGPRKAAKVEAARSEYRGSESASDLGAPSSSAGANPVAGSAGGAGSSDASAELSAAKPSPEIRDRIPRSARVTAMVGASPALMESHLLYAPEPAYPNLARIAHVQGPVVVEALVGRDGTVVRAHAITGHRMLRSAAEEAVYGRRYRPYVVDGIPMAVRTLITVDFKLR